MVSVFAVLTRGYRPRVRTGATILVALLALVFVLLVPAQAWATSYRLPWTYGQSYSVTLGNGSGSHIGAMYYAWDFGLPSGTVVRAAAAGTVVAVNRLFQGQTSTANWGNYVVISHPDGTRTRYAHLQYNSIPPPAYVGVGRTVVQGQFIGRSGNTGFSSGPRLHFQREDSAGSSVACSFVDVGGGGVPVEGQTITAYNMATPSLNANVIMDVVDTAGASVWFKFTVSERASYVIDVDRYTLPCYADMYLYGPGDRTTLIARSVPNSDLVTANLAPGTYYVRVRASSVTAKGTFGIAVKVNLTYLEVSGPPASGNITPAGDCEWYRFVVPERTTYIIDTDAGTLTDSYMYLLGPQSFTNVLAQNDNASSTDSMAKITKTLAPGVYYLKVRARSSAATGTFTVRIFRASTRLSVGGAPVSGRISPADDVDWYRFTVSSADSYTIDTDAGTLTYTYMQLFGPNSQTYSVVDSVDTNPPYPSDHMARITWNLVPGTYYIRVSAPDPDHPGGTYTIRVWRN